MAPGREGLAVAEEEMKNQFLEAASWFLAVEEKNQFSGRAANVSPGRRKINSGRRRAMVPSRLGSREKKINFSEAAGRVFAVRED